MALQEVADVQEKLPIRRMVRLSEEEDQFLRQRATVTGITPSWTIRDALRVYRSFYLPGVAQNTGMTDRIPSTDEVR